MNLNQGLSFLLLLQLIGCTDVTHNQQKLYKLIYESEVVEIAPLSCSLIAEATNHDPDLKLNIELKNKSPFDIIINRVSLENSGGIQAKPKESISGNVINTKTKSSVQLSFTPINNYELYALTGNYGLFLQNYYVIIDLKIDNQIKSLRLEIQMLEDQYQLYIKNTENSFIAYKFKKDDFFIRNQEEYLKKIVDGSTFVNITDNELAVAGLNFRTQSYWEHDTLYTNLFLVNHAEFSLAIDTSEFDIDHKSTLDKKRIVNIEKISGDIAEPTILRKGERCIITLKKLKRNVNDNLVMSILNTFSLTNGKSLFAQNLELIRY